MKQDIDHALVEMVRQASPASREALRRILKRKRSLGTRLDAWMVDSGRTNEDVAETLGISARSVTRARNGDGMSRKMEARFERLVAS